MEIDICMSRIDALDFVYDREMKLLVVDSFSVARPAVPYTNQKGVSSGKSQNKAVRCRNATYRTFHPPPFLL